jgi:CheY-like chemotaxis protein
MSREDRATVFAKALPRVLVVEDDEGVRRLVHRILRSMGCIVVSVDAAAAARAVCGTEHCFHLAIVDFVLPDSDGDTLIRELRASLGPSAPRFIILSGLSQVPVPEGVVAVISKPFALPHFVDEVKSALGDRTAG